MVVEEEGWAVPLVASFEGVDVDDDEVGLLLAVEVVRFEAAVMLFPASGESPLSEAIELRLRMRFVRDFMVWDIGSWTEKAELGS